MRRVYCVVQIPKGDWIKGTGEKHSRQLVRNIIYLSKRFLARRWHEGNLDPIFWTIVLLSVGGQTLNIIVTLVRFDRCDGRDGCVSAPWSHYPALESRILDHCCRFTTCTALGVIIMKMRHSLIETWDCAVAALYILHKKSQQETYILLPESVLAFLILVGGHSFGKASMNLMW